MLLPNLSGLERRLDNLEQRVNQNNNLVLTLVKVLEELNKNVVRQNELLQNKQIEQERK